MLNGKQILLDFFVNFKIMSGLFKIKDFVALNT